MSQITTSTEPSLFQRIRALKTPARGLLMDLYDAWANAIEIPNAMLPKHLHGRTGRSAMQILHPKLTPEQIRKQEAEEREIEKELRLEAYCADVNSGREIRFHENEEKLNQNQITFANLIGLEFDE